MSTDTQQKVIGVEDSTTVETVDAGPWTFNDAACSPANYFVNFGIILNR